MPDRDFYAIAVRVESLDVQAMPMSSLDLVKISSSFSTIDISLSVPSSIIAPYITDLSPSSGITLPSRLAAISFDIQNAIASEISIWLKYKESEDTFIVYDGSASGFAGRYSNSSVATISPGRYRFQITENGGWRDHIERLVAFNSGQPLQLI